MEIVINKCYGGFGLSNKAIAMYEKLTGTEMGWDGCLERDDPVLVTVVKKLKKEANGPFSELKIVEIPNNTEWEIDEYDGLETIHEKHMVWS